MTNFEILTGLKSAYTKLCNSFNDPIQDDCIGCPFEVFGDGCPLQEAIGLICDIETDHYKEKFMRLSQFVMSLDYMTQENLTISRSDDGTYSISRDDLKFDDVTQMMSALERT